ncbi:DUF1640 domain-containing protein [Methylobacterium terricola]|uniref:DUF1640 domain-containing protein n=1 Tax=Methylobacterium terricola TaxID=2583531 RepID=A0A5C4LEM7_9HYPH|nr:DUF1640 domain-containing protein [Methylobacterium terricola]TNC11084.1 DUF1640 domain-containing protein [Methylobacterium terricola]
MTAVVFDTLKLARTLRDKAKLSPDQAEGFAEAISEAVQGDLATKADVKASESALRADIKAVETSLRAEITSVETSLRAEIKVVANDLRTTEATLRAEIKSQVADAKADIIKWMVGAVGLQTVAIIGAMITLVRILKP